MSGVVVQGGDAEDSEGQSGAPRLDVGSRTAIRGEVTPTQYLREETRTVKWRVQQLKSPRVPHRLLVIKTQLKGGFF